MKKELIRKSMFYGPEDFRAGQEVELILQGCPNPKDTEKRVGIVTDNSYIRKGLSSDLSLRLMVSETRKGVPCKCHRDYLHKRIIEAYILMNKSPHTPNKFP